MHRKGIFGFETGRKLGIYQHGHARAIIWPNSPLAGESLTNAQLSGRLSPSSSPLRQLNTIPNGNRNIKGLLMCRPVSQTLGQPPAVNPWCTYHSCQCAFATYHTSTFGV